MCKFFIGSFSQWIEFPVIGSLTKLTAVFTNEARYLRHVGVVHYDPNAKDESKSVHLIQIGQSSSNPLGMGIEVSSMSRAEMEKIERVLFVGHTDCTVKDVVARTSEWIKSVPMWLPFFFTCRDLTAHVLSKCVCCKNYKYREYGDAQLIDAFANFWLL